jgi:hypothetical protein
MQVLISAFKHDRTLLDNLKRTEDLYTKLRALGLNPGHVFGVYKGVPEYSFKAEYLLEHLDDILLIAFHDFEQESILLVNHLNQAYLQFADRRVEPLPGLFQQVSRDVAESLDSYSKIGQEYWAVIE